MKGQYKNSIKEERWRCIYFFVLNCMWQGNKKLKVPQPRREIIRRKYEFTFIVQK